MKGTPHNPDPSLMRDRSSMLRALNRLAGLSQRTGHRSDERKADSADQRRRHAGRVTAPKNIPGDVTPGGD